MSSLRFGEDRPGVGGKKERDRGKEVGDLGGERKKRILFGVIGLRQREG